MKVVATYNIKGGVGETATAVNLSHMAAREGLRTLVWDLDPQGAATFYFRVKPKVRGGSRKLVQGKRELTDAVKGTDFENLDLVPADFSFRHFDIDLDQKKNPYRRLKKMLSPVKGEYDLVVLDCPPSISLVSEAVFHAADALLVPIIPTTLSLRTLEQLERFCAEQGLDDLRLMVFFSLADRRKRLHREVMEEIGAGRPDVLGAAIPYASEIERMGLKRAPLGSFAHRGRAVEAYEELWREVRERLF